jgi:hypothetical protein
MTSFPKIVSSRSPVLKDVARLRISYDNVLYHSPSGFGGPEYLHQNRLNNAQYLAEPRAEPMTRNRIIALVGFGGRVTKKTCPREPPSQSARTVSTLSQVAPSRNQAEIKARACGSREACVRRRLATGEARCEWANDTGFQELENIANLPSWSNGLYGRAGKKKPAHLLHDPIARQVCRDIECGHRVR